jgi:hypothetical protein
MLVCAALARLALPSLWATNAAIIAGWIFCGASPAWAALPALPQDSWMILYGRVG